MTPHWRWLFGIAVLLVWTVLLLIPIQAEWSLDAPAHWRLSISTLAHIIAYLVLTMIAGWLESPPPTRLWLLFGIMAHGVLAELVQPSVGRDGSVPDAAFDVLGVFLGLIVSRRYWFKQ